MSQKKIITKRRVDADRYSVKTISISSGIGSMIVSLIVNPLELLRVRIVRDMHQCDPIHFQNKSIRKTFLNANPGPQSSCLDCFPSSNSIVVAKHIAKTESLKNVWKSTPGYMLLGFSKVAVFYTTYENGNISSK